jgi:hypothetical protein
MFLREEVKVSGRWWPLYKIGQHDVTIFLREKLTLIPKSEVLGYRTVINPHPSEKEMEPQKEQHKREA